MFRTVISLPVELSWVELSMLFMVVY